MGAAVPPCDKGGGGIRPSVEREETSDGTYTTVCTAGMVYRGVDFVDSLLFRCIVRVEE